MIWVFARPLVWHTYLGDDGLSGFGYGYGSGWGDFLSHHYGYGCGDYYRHGDGYAHGNGRGDNND